MTTGANSNVIHEGIVFHVQTEDMGGEICEIVSMVFVDGAIIKTIKKDYLDLRGADRDSRRARLMTQHRTVIQAVLRGRFEAPGERQAEPKDRPSLIVTPLSDPREGESVSLLILVRGERSFKPVAGADIQVLFTGEDGVSGELHRAATDPKGFHLAEIKIPTTEGDKSSIKIEVSCPLGRTRAELQVLPNLASLRGGVSVDLEETPDLIVSDLGDPRAGEKASFMILLRGKKSCRPIGDASVQLLFMEEGQEARRIYQGETDRKGYNLAEVKLPSTDASEVSVIIEATCEFGTAEVVLPVLLP